MSDIEFGAAKDAEEPGDVAEAMADGVLNDEEEEEDKEELLDVYEDEYEDAVEFGGVIDDALGVAVGGFWGDTWSGLKKAVKIIYKNKQLRDVGCAALDATVPGAGSSLKAGIQVMDSAVSGNKTALAQIKAISDAAKAGDASKQSAHDMLQVVNEVRKETNTTATVGGGGHHGGGRRGGRGMGGVMMPYGYGWPDPWFMAEEVEFGEPRSESVELTAGEADAIAKRVAEQLKSKR